MINRLHRFHGHGSLRFVYQRGETVRGPLLALKFVRNSRRTTYRVAVVVSRKVHKSAVRRNRIRRRLYEIVRLLEPHITEPYDIVITVFSDQLANLPALEVQNTLQAQFRHAKILSVTPVRAKIEAEGES